MTTLNPSPERETILRSVPNGERQGPSAVEASIRTLLQPFTGVLFPYLFSVRQTNPAEISAETGSVATNASPSFLWGNGRSIADNIELGLDNSAAAGKRVLNNVTSTVGGAITNLFPWWFWALVGLALVAWIASLLAPVLRRAP
jgi:hypothetical protein